MKKLGMCGIAISMALFGASFNVLAADNPQQSRMASCNKDAGDKKGDARKAFMKECLSSKKAETDTKTTAQQQKMKTCNKEATGKKGDERKKFMSECLRG